MLITFLGMMRLLNVPMARFPNEKAKSENVPLPLLLTVALFTSTALTDEKGELAKPDPTTAAIAKNALVFVESFNDGDAAAIAAGFVENGEMSVDESGAGTIASASRDSTNDLVVNDDGSVNLYIGPSAPKGFEKIT